MEVCRQVVLTMDVSLKLVTLTFFNNIFLINNNLLVVFLTLILIQSSGSGRLKFNDFKDLMCSLKYWQAAFKNHTKEKTGILKAERLRDALLEVGKYILYTYTFTDV